LDDIEDFAEEEDGAFNPHQFMENLQIDSAKVLV
jgi:hypothetical protein